MAQWSQPSLDELLAEASEEFPGFNSDFPEGATYPDIEKIVGRVLRPLVRDESCIGNFVVSDFDVDMETDDPLEPILSESPFIEIHRRGGEYDPEDFSYYPNVEILFWGKSRSVANDTDSKAQILLLGLGGADVDGVQIDLVDDITGDQEVRQPNVDDRCVTRQFRFGYRPTYPD